jgi:hypothetical protein
MPATAHSFSEATRKDPGLLVADADFGYPAAMLFWLVLLPAARMLLARRHRRPQPLARAA